MRGTPGGSWERPPGRSLRRRCLRGVRDEASRRLMSVEHPAHGTARRSTNFSSRQESLGVKASRSARWYPMRPAGFGARICFAALFYFHSLWLFYENKSAHQMAHIPLHWRMPFQAGPRQTRKETPSSPELKPRKGPWRVASSQYAKVAGSIPSVSLSLPRSF